MNRAGSPHVIRILQEQWRNFRDGRLSDDPREQAFVDELRRQGCMVRPRQVHTDGKVRIDGYVSLSDIVSAIIIAGGKA